MGPLQGLRILELASIGPGPFAAMLLADMGATVIRVDRTQEVDLGLGLLPRASVLNRGRRSVAIDLKHPAGVEAVLRLVEGVDALIEGYRPGVTERLGVGPEPCLARNPRLVYARMTGYGQEGPLAHVPGHDIDFIALSGVLSLIGERGRGPVPPLNLVGDFGGGGMLLAFGILCGVFEARTSGRGQVLDAAMVDGAALLANMIQSLRSLGQWNERRGENVVDGGAPFYGAYETKDGGHVAVGAIEKPFYRRLLTLLGLDPHEFEPQMDRTRWPAWRSRLAEVFRTRTRDEWTQLLERDVACAMPVLSLTEAVQHPHNRARRTFVEPAGIPQAAPAPRFSRTPGALDLPPPVPGEHSAEVLAEAGLTDEEITRLLASGAVRAMPGEDWREKSA
jgi:alpha-methylacyl-CoA racemase